MSDVLDIETGQGDFFGDAVIGLPPEENGWPPRRSQRSAANIVARIVRTGIVPRGFVDDEGLLEAHRDVLEASHPHLFH